MPTDISGLRIARSFITPTDARVTRELDFQLGPRQGIRIESVLGGMAPDRAAFVPSVTTQAVMQGNQTLHFETGSLETVPDAVAEDEDSIDSEVFYRQDMTYIGNDDVTTEFRASSTLIVTPQGIVDYRGSLFTARNISHSGISLDAGLDLVCNVIIFYTFVEFTLAELGLILARRQ